MKRWLLILVAAFFTWTTSAHAETKVVVRSFSGPGNAAVRRSVVKQLKTMKGVKVVDEKAAQRVAKKRHASLGSNNGRREVASELQIAAWVDGRIKKKGGKLHASIEVIDASSGSEAGAWNFAAKKPKQLEATVKKQFKRELKGAFSGVSAPERGDSSEEPAEAAPAEPSAEEPYPAVEQEPAQEEAPEQEVVREPVAQAEDDESATGSFEGNEEQRIDGDEAEPRKREHSVVEARAGMAMLHRSLKYNEAFSQNIGNYSLAAAPVADFGVRIYPVGFVSNGWASNIGLDLHGQMAFGLNSETSDGTRYATSYAEYDASAVYRIPIKRHDVHFLAGYMAQNFKMDDKGSAEAPVADTEYKAGRFAAGGRFEIANGYGLGLDLAYLYLFGMGELQSADWFPNATGSGIEGQLYADARIYKSLNARLFASYQRQFFDFHSELNDTRVAGGAVDEYISAGLALGYTY